jgi:hypothetical protein
VAVALHVGELSHETLASGCSVRARAFWSGRF